MNKDLNRQFIKKVQVANTYVNVCSVSVIIREMQITTTVKCTISNLLHECIRMITLNTADTNVGKRNDCTVVMGYKVALTLWKTYKHSSDFYG